jgi:hypothetical protein
MQFHRIVLGSAVVLAFASLAFPQQANPLSGTWKLNVAKSKWSPGPPSRSATVVYEVTQNGIKAIRDNVTSQGQAAHIEFTCVFDGKPCPYQVYTIDGKPNPSAGAGNAWRKIDDYTFEFVNNLTTTRMVVAKDGKTLTRTTTGKTDQGQAENDTAVYEKQ